MLAEALARLPDLRELEQAERAGIELGDGLAGVRDLLRTLRDAEAELPDFRDAVAAAEAERLAQLEAMTQQRTELFPSQPANATDWLVVGAGIDAAPNSIGEMYDTARELDGKRYGFHPNRELHFVPDDVMRRWPGPGRMPGRHLRAPSKLLVQLRGDFSRPPLPGAADALSYEGLKFDAKGYVGKASSIIRACSVPALLGAWLESERAEGDEAAAVVCQVIEERLAELGEGEADETEDAETDDESEEDAA